MTSEQRRLETLRTRQRTFTVETALGLENAGRDLGQPSIDLAGIQKTLAALRTLQPALVPWSTGGNKKPVFPDGVELPNV